MPVAFEPATFEPLVGDDFRIVANESVSITAALVEVTVLGESNRETGRIPFSIVFRGPTSPVLPQRIYAVEQATLEPVELFLVPLGPDDGGMLYEAVFG